MKLTRAQKRMLLDACNPRFCLYGAPAFICARNLMNKGLVRLCVDDVKLTDLGEKVAQELMDRGSDKIED